MNKFLCYLFTLILGAYRTSFVYSKKSLTAPFELSIKGFNQCKTIESTPKIQNGKPLIIHLVELKMFAIAKIEGFPEQIQLLKS